MKCVVVGILVALASHAPSPSAAEMRRIAISDYLDKARGAWAGQMIGVCYGAPTEFKSPGRIIEDELPPWTPNRIRHAIGQDDLYVELTFLEALEMHGLDLTPHQAGQVFAESGYRLWHANAVGRENIRAGTQPPSSGHPRYNRHANDIDFQIESDLFGIICPGLPRWSNKLCDLFGHLMNYGDGVYGGMFVAGMYTAAYFDDDPETIVRSGLACIHPQSRYAQVIKDVLAAYADHPHDWKQCWHIIHEQWGDDDYCPSGYGKPFNIDAKVNGAYIAIGLLYGNRDFARTIDVATRCGDDSDCNPSSAGGVLGTMLGYESLPEVYKAGIPDITDEKFDWSEYSYADLPGKSLEWAKRVIERAGGVVLDEAGTEYLLIPVQSPEPPAALEQFTESMLREYWLEP